MTEQLSRVEQMKLRKAQREKEEEERKKKAAARRKKESEETPSPAPVQAPLKILTAEIVAEKIRNSIYDMEGELVTRGFIIRKERDGRARTSSLSYLIRIFRELMNEGFK